MIHNTSGLYLDLCGIAIEAETGKTIGGFWMKGIPSDWNRITEYPTLNLHRVQRPEGLHWQLTDPESWLTALYGNWRIPDPDFDTVIAAYNLRSFSWLVQFYALQRILTYWRCGKLAKAGAITRHCLRHLPGDPLLQAIAIRLAARELSTQKSPI